MAGKISDAEKNLKINNKINSNMVKISSSKSSLSYQNGSVLNTENSGEKVDEGMPRNGYLEEITLSQEPFSEDQNLKSECLDLLRKKLISDLSLTVFSPDLENKLAKMDPIEVSRERQSVIQKILVQISQLSDAEKLLLYLKLPSSTSSPFDPLRQPLNPLGNRQEIQQTIVWIKTHLEEDSEISIPKQDVYDQYLKYCENVSMKPLSTADFGKVMKQVYPGVRPRRLGTRGNSRYCYSGMRNTCKLPTPILPQWSVENSVSNGSPNEDSFLSVGTNKCKKVDRSKRKLKSTTCQNEKCTTFNRSCSVAEKVKGKNVKRPKLQDKESKTKDSKEVESVKEHKIFENPEELKREVDLCGIKCEESSDNSFSTLEFECGLESDLGIYYKNVEKVAEDSPTKSSAVCESPSGIENNNKEKKNEFEKKLFKKSESPQILAADRNGKSYSEGNLLSLVSCDPGEKSDAFKNHIKNKVNRLDGLKHSKSVQRKPTKSRARRSAFFSKPVKNMRKYYVPIQPKPIDMHKFNVQLEQSVGINQIPSEPKLEPEGLSLCEESDSQEPEEEIVRYFKHLDENEINADNLIDQAVKNIDNPTVQNSNLPQIISKNSTSYRISDDVLNLANQQVLRSQSCFEVQRQLFNFSEPVAVPRSQSSVELPMAVEPTHHETMDPDSGGNGKTKKISHLRILLEKSISTGNKMPNSSFREGSNVPSGKNPAISTAQIANPVSQVSSNEPSGVLSSGKLVERDIFKLNGLKILSPGSPYVPQSPNNRTKYFSFTPISPGPQSPLKTSSTPSASPFVSPRSTPVPRSRQSFNNDFFLSPSEKKSISFRSDCKKTEFVSENDFNFSKMGNFRVDRNKQATYVQSYRPRSFSSTNFCRSKARRHSSKLVGFDQSVVTLPNKTQTVAQSNFLVNAQFSIHKNFVSSECLSKEVRKFLENNSTISEDRSATIRSQSVPLNRMISESTWAPTEVSPVYSSYFNSESSNPTLAPFPGKAFPDWTSNSETNSPINIAANVSPFLPDGEMTNLEPGPLNNEVFSEDPTIVQLDQYFSGNEENFSKSDPFHEESAFSNKFDLNSTETFDSPFTNESDPAIAENIKSYLPDFEGLENKNLGNDDGVTNERKLLKTPSYERGNENLKDPVITSFKPILTNEMSSCPGSPVLSFFENKVNEDNQQLIEFFNFED